MIATRSTRRWFNVAGVAIAAGLMSYALYAQHVQGYEPCPLCILQRIAMIVLGLAFAVAALHAPRGAGARLYGVLGALVALTGAAISGWQVRLQHLPPADAPVCGPGYDYIMDTFGWIEGLWMIFAGSGDCAKVDWSLWGLSMPAWVSIWFLALAVLAIAANWSRLSSSNGRPGHTRPERRGGTPGV